MQYRTQRVDMKRTGHYGIPIRLCILLSLFYVTTSLTPPRILYGGWTPILPGHPFHFGSVRKQIELLRNQQRYPSSEDERIPPFHQHSPVHEVEHEYEHHVEFVEPEQYHRPGIYTGSQGHTKGQHIFPSSPNKGNHLGHQLTYSGRPIRGQHIALGGNNPNKDINPYRPHHTIFDGPHGQTPGKEHRIISSGHKSNKDSYNYYSPQKTYDGLHSQKPVKEQDIIYGHKSKKNIFEYYPPQSAYDGPHAQKPVKEQHISYDHKPKKNIFDYYPPQSAYEGPKEPGLSYKPVYFEIPRKPLDAFEIPKQNIPYILPSVKDLPLKALNLQGLGPLGNVGEKTFLRITPLHPNALKTIGDINLDAIQYLSQESPKHTKYPVIKDSSGGTPDYSKIAQYAFSTYGKHITPVAQQNYDVDGIVLDQNSADRPKFPIIEHSFKRRPLNPIDTKNYGNTRYYNEKLQLSSLPLKLSPLSSISTSPLYSSDLDLYSDLKYPSKSLGVSKNLLSPVVLGNSLSNQVKKYLGPKMPRYKNSLLQPFYPKTPVPSPIFPYQPVTKPLVHIPPLRTMPKVVSNNYPKMQMLYKNPGVVANIRGSPALVEREVAIIHVPVTSTKQEYPIDKEYLYYTASTPESTHIRDIENLNNGSISILENDHVVNSRNVSNFSPLFEYGKNSPEQSSDEPERGRKRVPTSEFEGNSVEGKFQYPNSNYIYVSGTGIHDDSEAKKQFFHAYYAPSDHMPPPGYVRMTVEEFGDLFKNAEIRYVDKDPISISSHDSGQQNS